MTQRSGTQESSLLLTLEEISQLVSHSHDPGETLANIVRLIQGRFHTDVCSVYLLEPDRAELVLGATIGLKPESIGHVRMRLDEGLTGLVGQQMAPVMVEDAFQHHRFKFFAVAGEDPYHSFLGVPLVEGGMLQGVLVVQTVEARTFSANEIRMLVTVGSQLAPLVSEARLLERVVAAAHEDSGAMPATSQPRETRSLQGISLSPGIGVGEAYLVNGFDESQRTIEKPTSDPACQRRRLASAMERAREEINRLSHRISALLGEDHGAILQAQLMILQDRKIEQDLTGLVSAGATAESALLETLNKYVAAFEKLAPDFFQDRVYDVKDVFRRILWYLRPRADTPDALDAAKRIVLVAAEVSVMDLFSVDLDRLAAVVVEHGGPQSHAAILARSLRVPMVGQVRELDKIEPGRQLLVDATTGAVSIDPAPHLVAAHACKAAELDCSLSLQSQVAAAIAPAARPVRPEQPARLGLPRIEANINLLCEVSQAIEQGSAGVGLYRTEFLFLARRTLPTEEEQVGTYRKLLDMLGGRPASIRTFDLRPDKIAHCAHLSSTASGPLDWRLVLDSPPLQKLFRDQVRAILRAAAVGAARILVPLVTRTEQLDFVIDTVGQARDELGREGLEYGRHVPLGIMIEVAAAALMAEHWAEQVDFFAVGTNDLIASALGFDRDDPVVASLNDPLHPAVLGTIRDLVTVAKSTGRPVTVCGEMAADPEGILALAALGVNSLSVAVNQLAAVRRTVAEQSPERLGELGERLIGLSTGNEARKEIQSFTRAQIDVPGSVPQSLPEMQPTR